ncbi:MAG: NTP transferase domain-containing protein [Methanomicrobiales archaeon]|nr:NTP transferase domain-containing protein [Methanomicrobiales archaeon]
MRALIMAGGEGSRLNLGEKPLVTICGRPMIAYVISAFTGAGMEVVVIASPRTPMTQNWCRSNGVSVISASGEGYVSDLVEAVGVLQETGPFFTSVSDLPCLEPDLIAAIHDAFTAAGTDALSTWVPVQRCRAYDCRTRYVETIGGENVCPAGVNILNGSRIEEEQEEHPLVLDDARLAFNINTREELAAARSFLCPGRSD